MSEFLSKYNVLLDDYARLSQSAGARMDYVQGGGGNTSVKLDDTYMAVKASGFLPERRQAGSGVCRDGLFRSSRVLSRA